MIDMKCPVITRRPGRPSGFDRTEILDRAMLFFWKHGYESSSVSELTRVMGITSPSLYAAFGDKKGLFRAAVERYMTRDPNPSDLVAEAPTARDAARALMEGAVITYTGEETPPGCLLASSAIACSSAAYDIGDELANIRRAVEGTLRDRIDQAVCSGELPLDTDADALTGVILSVVQGMSTLARDGASRDRLFRIVRMTMAVWPTK